MPFIHVKSLPLQKSTNIEVLLKNLSKTVAKETQIDEKHFTVTWNFFEPQRYCCAGKISTSHNYSSHPILVDVLVPDFFREEKKAHIMEIIAENLNANLQCDIKNIFIHCREARSGEVFDKGEVAHW